MNRNGAAILAPLGTELSLDEAAFFRDFDPWGFIVFARNLETPAQIRALCSSLRDAVGRDAPILIDQEGGRVQRLRPPLAREWLPPLDFAERAGDQAVNAMYMRYRIIAAELLDLGIDANCAPMADIARDRTHAFLRNRCYGTNVQDVVALSRAVAGAHLDGGVLPILKHMPGHGLAQLDSHLDVPRITQGEEYLDAHDFAAFRALNDLPMGMTAHLIYEVFDQQPATVSSWMMNLIREDIGFGGLIMTDDISMQALSGTVATRSAAALSAGCDVVLHCNGDLAEMQAVANACGPLRENARKRAQAALDCRCTPNPVDIDALDAQLKALLSGQGDG